MLCVTLLFVIAIFKNFYCVFNKQCYGFMWIVKGFNHTHTCIHSPPNSPSIQTATQHWAEFPVLYSRSLLKQPPFCTSVIPPQGILGEKAQKLASAGRWVKQEVGWDPCCQDSVCRAALCQQGTAALARAPPTLHDETHHRNNSSRLGCPGWEGRLFKKAMLSRLPRHGISISAFF